MSGANRPVTNSKQPAYDELWEVGNNCRAPNWDEFQRFQEAAEGGIRIVTLAGEFSETPAFIRRAANSGVVVAIPPGRAGVNNPKNQGHRGGSGIVS